MIMDGMPENCSYPGHPSAPVTMSFMVAQSDDVAISLDSSSFEADEADDDDDDSVKDAGSVVELVSPPKPCELCGQSPCDWISFGDQIIEECDEMMDQNLPTNQIRFHAYRLYTQLRFGVLHKHDRRPLPVCVCGEIMDSYPDPNHQYVGFRDALNDVAVHDDDT